MLIPKPLLLWKQHQAEVANGNGGGGHGHGADGRGHHAALSDEEGKVAEEEEEFDLAEVVIHQVIETIEFVLGTVSHTASYLRLWALSLAHQQLSLVFFEKSMSAALESGNPIAIYLGFAVLMAITAGVLLGMDVLECFLHTLRLHWVEFQSKFFKADGYFFTPFSHEVNLKE